MVATMLEDSVEFLVGDGGNKVDLPYSFDVCCAGLREILFLPSSKETLGTDKKRGVIWGSSRETTWQF